MTNSQLLKALKEVFLETFQEIGLEKIKELSVSGLSENPLPKDGSLEEAA